MDAAFPRVSLLGTEDRRFYSALVGREYQLAVWLPESYVGSEQHYPVIYLLDGDAFFGAAVSLIPLLSILGKLPEMIIVGIGYGSFENWGLLRELDFKIPEVQAEPENSHADWFLAALKQEIIPFIEANYRADPKERLLAGYSSGGFFTVYALIHEPGLFRRYLAGSPDTDLSCPYLLANDQALVSREPAAPIDLFLTVGSLEDGTMQSSVASFQEMVKAIHARGYPGIRFFSEIYEGENHGAGGITLTYINGLRKCF